MIDPTTGLPRLIFGNSQGVWSVLDDNGTFETSVDQSQTLAGSSDRPASTATATSRSRSSTTVRLSPATTPPLGCRRLVLRRRPGQRRNGLCRQHPDHGQSPVERVQSWQQRARIWIAPPSPSISRARARSTSSGFQHGTTSRQHEYTTSSRLITPAELSACSRHPTVCPSPTHSGRPADHQLRGRPG